MSACGQAISTVIGIIEGCGTLGATLGCGLMIRFLDTEYCGSHNIFLLLLLFPAMLLAVVPLAINLFNKIYITRSFDVINCCKACKKSNEDS